MTPEEHAAAQAIAAKVLSFHDSIPPEIRAVVFLNWNSGRHSRRRPGACIHCHSPALTDLVDDDGRYSHKLCAEISRYLLIKGRAAQPGFKDCLVCGATAAEISDAPSVCPLSEEEGEAWEEENCLANTTPDPEEEKQ